MQFENNTLSGPLLIVSILILLATGVNFGGALAAVALVAAPVAVIGWLTVAPSFGDRVGGAMALTVGEGHPINEEMEDFTKRGESGITPGGLQPLGVEREL